MLWLGDIVILLLTGALTGAALTQTWPAILPDSWATLLAGLLAFIGAALTVRKMGEQIQAQGQLSKAENDRENEKLKLYARTRFLMNANLLFDGIKSFEEYIVSTYVKDESDTPSALPVPIKFDEVFDPSLILPDDETSGNIQEILSILQIVQARLPSLYSTDVLGEPESSLSYVFQAQWLSIQILKDARTTAARCRSDEGFRQYLLERINFKIDRVLEDSEKRSDLALCKAYLEAHRNGNLLQP